MSKHIQLPLMEIFLEGNSRSKKLFKSYFLYCDSPTNWRQNWRNISGFYVALLGKSVMVVCWRIDEDHFWKYEKKTQGKCI